MQKNIGNNKREEVTIKAMGTGGRGIAHLGRQAIHKLTVLHSPMYNPMWVPHEPKGHHLNLSFVFSPKGNKPVLGGEPDA